MPLHVLNPDGGDSFQDFSQELPLPDNGHAPVNFHAYAAATKGVFARKVEELPLDDSPVLVLLRRRLAFSLKAISALDGKRPLWVSWKETGTDQVKKQLSRWGNKTKLVQILARVEGAICPVNWIHQHYKEFAGEKFSCPWVPTPYPLLQQHWDFRRPWSEKNGILLATREFKVPKRHHRDAILAALLLQQKTQQPVTIVNTEGSWGAKQIEEICAPVDAKVRVLEGKLSYAKWLELISEHKLVWQLDDSGVPGQVAGDSLLAGTICLGGLGTNDRILLEAWRAKLTRSFRDKKPFFLAESLLQQQEKAGEKLVNLWQDAGKQIDYAAGIKRLEQEGILS